MYVWRKIVERWCNVYSSSAVLTAWYHLIRKTRFGCGIMSPVRVKHTYICLHVKWQTFIPDFNTILELVDTISQQSLHVNPSRGSCTDTCRRTVRWWDRQAENGRWGGEGEFHTSGSAIRYQEKNLNYEVRLFAANILTNTAAHSPEGIIWLLNLCGTSLCGLMKFRTGKHWRGSSFHLNRCVVAPVTSLASIRVTKWGFRNLHALFCVQSQTQSQPETTNQCVT